MFNSSCLQKPQEKANVTNCNTEGQMVSGMAKNSYTPKASFADDQGKSSIIHTIIPYTFQSDDGLSWVHQHRVSTGLSCIGDGPFLRTEHSHLLTVKS